MSQEREGEQQSRRDFFISYTGRDRQWAEWIAWQLEEAGYTLFLQAWDVRPGSNTVAEMENALKSAERTLLVLSSAYLQSDDTFAQWAVPFRADPGGAHRSLLPVCIEPCEVKGLLGPIGCIDLISLEEGQARERLLEGAKAERAKPTTVAFPLHTIPPVAFPGSVPWLWNVPYLRNPHFTGRDEVLITLSEHLALVAHDDQRQVRPVALTQRQAITGLGGIGKTQIAVEYAYRSRDLGHYTHTCWVNAASEETIIASFVSIAQLLPCLSAHDETDQRKQVEAVKHWLEQCQEPWLLIFDNADEVALVGNYLPHQGNGSVLLTTRAHAVGGLATSVEVETMGLVEGTHLLLRRAQRFEHASDEEVNLAGNIVVALDHFPLALDQAGAYIEETGCSFVDYLALYQTHRKALLAQRGEQVVNYPDSVATTWLLSFQKVQQKNPAAAELLELCSFLAPDRIPEELLREGAASWPAPLQQAVADPLQFQHLMADLLKFSLLKRHVEDGILSIHRLVQVVQIDNMKREVQYQWAERVVRAMETIVPIDPDDVSTWPQCLRYLDQAQACSNLIASYQLTFIEAIFLLNRVGGYLVGNALYAQAESLHQRALALCERLLGTEHPQTATSLERLAIAYADQGKYAQAEPLYQRALRIREQQLGPLHPDTAASLNNLALLYSRQGKYAQAEPLYQRALRIREQQLGSQHPATAASFNNLADIHRLQGKYAQAEPLYQRALRVREQRLGLLHPDTALSLNNLGELYRLQGKYDQAESLYYRAWCIFKQQWGAEHLHTAGGLNNLARIYVTQGKLEQAEQLYDQALTIYEQQLGSDHSDTLLILNNLAELYRLQGKYAQAEPLFQRALHLREQQFGPQHPHLAHSLTGLANLYHVQGNFLEAEKLFQRALSIRERAFVPHHPDTADTLEGFAALRVAQGKMQDAAVLYQRVLVIREAVYEPLHPKTKKTHEHLQAVLAEEAKQRKKHSYLDASDFMRGMSGLFSITRIRLKRMLQDLW